MAPRHAGGKVEADGADKEELGINNEK